MKRRLIIFALAAFIFTGSLVLDGCKKTDRVMAARPIDFTIPPGFPPTVYSFQSNPLTEEGFRLGKKLFYDGRLSLDGTISCGSCHQPEAAFTTYEHDRSHGYNHSHTLRNAPGLSNLAWYPVFNQDGSASSLAALYQAHITSPIDMAETMGGVVAKLRQDDNYKQLFLEAFGDDKVTADRIYRALSQFVVSLVSANSKYDKVRLGQASFTAQEASGYQVFQQKCGSCHTEPLFTDFSFRNIGLEVDNNLKDYGRMRVTGSPADSLKFRVPSLRNLGYTSYYLHDGRLSIPRHVLWHYRTGVNAGPTVDPLVAGGISMTDTDEDNLVHFLRTLNDTAFFNNPRFRE
ncbi:MAG TPA: cytochrome c peroxidase [Flavisolibacter sp.]|nr:cytochrome c peroxidase [Flavisolibacter sp.]